MQVQLMIADFKETGTKKGGRRIASGCRFFFFPSSLRPSFRLWPLTCSNNGRRELELRRKGNAFAYF